MTQAVAPIERPPLDPVAPPIRSPSAGRPWVPPRRNWFVPRARLIARLTKAADVPLVVIVAPAGYGKTTVLTEWGARDGRPFAWIRCESSTTSLAVSIAHALEDMETIEPGFAGAIERAGSARRAVLLGNALCSSTRPFVLVVDDADRFETLESIAGAAENLPAGSQIAFAARREPALPLGRLRAHRSLVELRERDLIMTRFEAASLLDLAGLDAALDDVEKLMHITEGWPAGLYLAAVSLADQPDRAAALERFGGDDYVVVDYFKDEFLSGLPDDAHDFLIRSAVLGRLSGPLCDAVLERQDSALVLKRFARDNLLISRLDRGDHRYRYHQLFAQALRAELRRREPELEPELHGRASRWYESFGDVDGALHHAVAAADVERAGDLLWRHLTGYLARGRASDIEHLIASVGETVASSRRLTLAAAHTAIARGTLDVARCCLAAAEPLRQSGPRDDELDAAQLLIRAVLADDGLVQMSADAARADSLLGERSPWRSLCLLLRGVAEQIAGGRDKARAYLEEGASRGVVDAPDMQALCLAQLALLALDGDDRQLATIHALHARAQIERCGTADQPLASLALAVAALVRAHRGSVEEAKADLQRATAVVEALSDFIPWYRAETDVALARTALRLGDVARARGFAARASAFAARLTEATALHRAVTDAHMRIEQVATASVVSSLALTTAELRVLWLLPTHLSFREIAKRLYVSANTVKTQVHAVYRKLNVSSRSEAVGRARILGILDADDRRHQRELGSPPIGVGRGSPTPLPRSTADRS